MKINKLILLLPFALIGGLFLFFTQIMFPTSSSPLVKSNPIPLTEIVSEQDAKDFINFLENRQIAVPAIYVKKLFSNGASFGDGEIILPANYKGLSKEQNKFILLSYIRSSSIESKFDSNLDGVYDNEDESVQLLKKKKIPLDPAEIAAIKKSDGILIRNISFWPLEFNYEKITWDALNLSIDEYVDMSVLRSNLELRFKEMLVESMRDRVPDISKRDWGSTRGVVDYFLETDYKIENYVGK